MTQYKEGDKVKIIKQFKDNQGFLWLESMTKTLGKIGTVGKRILHDRIQIEFKEDINDYWFYSYESIQPATTLKDRLNLLKDLK